MSLWQQYHFEERILQILQDVAATYPGHHLGRPFVTPYQIAIEYTRRYPIDAEQLGLQVGGRSIGKRTSLAQYIGRELSRKIRRGELRDVEGGFLANQHLADISFNHAGLTISSSLTDTQYPLSLFRWNPGN